MATEIRPAHSPLGASGAERWMHCPGSVALLKELDLPETDEPEYRSLGTTAHAAAYECLSQGLDAWEVIDRQFDKHVVDLEMATAVQMYLDECRRIMAEHPGGTMLLEQSIDSPGFHKDFYGTVDFAYIVGAWLFVRDFKYGEGIAIDVEGNPQVKYYAYGILRSHPEVHSCDLGICQPRGFHPDGPIRTCEIPASGEGSVVEWAETELRPAMERTALDNDLVAGAHCRFCPAKLVCPLMQSLFGAAMTADPKTIPKLTTASLDRSYPFVSAVKFYLKALEEEVLRRLNTGVEMDTVKLVQKKADRVFKDGALEVFTAAFGQEAYTEPKLKTPAQMERLGQDAKVKVNEWAYTPMTGLTVALKEDKRPAVKVSTMKEKFAFVAGLDKSEE